ncbi:DUF742 domain-containing protein [Nonomuraea sp. NPDC050663]|uniref:DUF742 domain-containing protein n=1 Tax=Nonomuraea sp. NPDC050663 TaxID=3364370 RepID=UPI0018203DD0|nr:DUF742 domain-containing protein [Thermoactinospora sp.]
MSDDEWVDEAVVRPYALTRGRTRSSGSELDLLASVAASGKPVPERADLSVHHRRMLAQLAGAKRVAEVASELGLPVGVARVLLGDLLDMGLAEVRQAPAAQSSSMESLLREVIDGLRAL